MQIVDDLPIDRSSEQKYNQLDNKHEMLRLAYSELEEENRRLKQEELSLLRTVIRLQHKLLGSHAD